MPAIKIASGFEKYMKSVAYIEMQRQKIVMTRIYRKKYYEKVFEREIRFLIEFFGTGKTKNRTYLKGLKKIRKDQIQAAIDNYQRKMVCEYMIMTR